MNVRTTLPDIQETNASAAGLRRTALLVLGMHRSATGALTRMLNLLGCALPRTSTSEPTNNERGLWESATLADLNDGLLAAAGSAWDDWLPINTRFTESAEAACWLQTARVTLREEYGDAPLFVLKDPRICRLVPFWRQALAAEAIDPLIVMPLRSPIEVARSLAERNGLDETEGLLLWLRHALDAEAATRDLPRIFLSYDQLLLNCADLVERFTVQLGVVWPRLSPLTELEVEQLLTPRLRHHQSTDIEISNMRSVVPWVWRAYTILSAWTVSGEKAGDRAELDQLRAAFDDAGPVLLRPFVSMRQAKRQVSAAEAQRAATANQRDTLASAHDAMIGELTRLKSEYARLSAGAETIGRERDELIVERDHLAADRQGVIERLDSITAEQTSLASECASLAAELSREQDLAGRHWAETQRLHGEQRNLAKANAALAEELRQEQQRAAGNWDERCRFAAEANVLRQSFDRVDNERANLRDVLAEARIEHRHEVALVQNALRQREEQVFQTEALLTQALRERQEDAENRATEIAALLEKFEDVSARFGQLEQTVADQGPYIDELSHLLTVRNAEIEALREKFAAYNQQVDSETRRYESALAQERWRRDAIDSQRIEAMSELETLRMQQHESEAKGDIEAQLAASLIELADERIRFAGTLAARKDEIAALNEGLNAAKAFENRNERGRHIAVALAGTPWWWALVPSAWRKRWLEGRLLRRGLFDAHAYLERYPDVARSGISPVLHFLRHGLAEGRDG